MYKKMLEFLSSTETPLEVPMTPADQGDSLKTRKASADMHRKEAEVEKNRQRDYSDNISTLKKGLSSATLSADTKKSFRDRLKSLTDKVKASKQKQRAAQSLSSVK
jgi:hypothetical protein